MADVIGTSIITLLAIGLMSFLQRALRPDERPLAWLALLSHLPAAIAMVLVTREVLGGGDLLNYHRVGSAIADRMTQDFTGLSSTLIQVMMHQVVPLPVPAHGIGSATGAMYALSSFLVFFMGQSIYATCALVGYAAFFSCLALFVTVREELPESSSPRLLVACLLVPSVVFWSSALLKESIALSAVCAMLVGGQWIARRRRLVGGSVLMFAGAAIVAMLKPYVLVPFGMAAGVWFYMVAVRSDKAPQLKLLNVLVGSVVAVALVLGTGALFPQYSFETFAEETAHHQEVGKRWSGDADYVLADDDGEIGIDGGERSLAAQFRIAPLALFTALFRPLIFEAGNAQMVVNSLETTGILALAILGLYRNGLLGSIRRIARTPLLMFCAVFVLGLALGVGLATTNLGTLSRYRVPFMPFFAILLLELADIRGRVSEGVLAPRPDPRLA